MGLFSGRRADTPAWQSEDPKIRRAAVARLEDASILAEVLQNDSDDEVKRRAHEALVAVALSLEPGAAQRALAALSEEAALLTVARSAALAEVAQAALARLTSPKSLGAVARQGSSVAVRIEAVRRLQDAPELASIALKTEEKDVAMAALDHLADGGPLAEVPSEARVEILSSLSERARNKAVAKRARTLLRGDEEPAVPAKPRPADRGRQKEICEAMELLAHAVEPEGLLEKIEQARGEWIDLIPDVDADFEERFEAAWRAARENRTLRLEETSRRRAAEQERAREQEEKVIPRLDLIRRVEALLGADLEVGQREARSEWERLRVLDSQEGEALRERFEAACAGAEARLSAWAAEQGALRESEEKESRRAEQERREKAALRRLEQIGARADKLLASPAPTLKAVEKTLREIREAQEQPGELPSAKERSAWMKRLRGLQETLAPRFAELQEAEGWKHWANETVQEELCAQAESLTEVADPAEAARLLQEIQNRWRQAGTVSREKSQRLWSRFKAARDAMRSRLEALSAENVSRKEEICRQAEALESSLEWKATAEVLQRLQADWKGLGSAGPGRDRALWLRFRGTCDRFFTRRKEDLKARKAEWTSNLHAREALCAKAESLADSADWETTAAELKKLQKDWKAIGPVGGKDSDASWKRFREACDRFFQRYKRRHEIEQEQRASRREELCARLEALAAGGEIATGGDLSGMLDQTEKDWQEAPALPPRLMPPWEERYHGALERVIAAFPDRLAGSPFDARRNRELLEEILERVEKLMPERSTSDTSHLSPATRLATMWVEAMAANTIGGKLPEDTHLRAAQEEVRRAQSAWQKIGHVPADVRRDLTRRFQRACARIAEMSTHLSGETGSRADASR
jgi:hypothetical protein